MATRTNYPTYPPDFLMALRLFLPFLLGVKRSFHEDALKWFKGLRPTPIITGKEFIPQRGPFALAINHYYRPNYHAWWSVLAASAIIPVEIHWIMTEAWTFPNRRIGKYLEAGSRVVFRRLAKLFQFSVMPPMPPRAWEVQARAASVRQILEFVHKNPNAAIGIAPEGGDSATGKLEMPPPGVGRFIMHLAQAGLAIHPLGIYEADGALHLNFGKTITPLCLTTQTTDERDLQWRQEIMQALAELLPENLRENFSKKSLTQTGKET